MMTDGDAYTNRQLRQRTTVIQVDYVPRIHSIHISLVAIIYEIRLIYRLYFYTRKYYTFYILNPCLRCELNKNVSVRKNNTFINV